MHQKSPYALSDEDTLSSLLITNASFANDTVSLFGYIGKNLNSLPGLRMSKSHRTAMDFLLGANTTLPCLIGMP